MSSLLISDLDTETQRKLRTSAEAHGRSLAAEATELLKSALRSVPLEPEDRLDDDDWVDRIRARFEAVGGVDLPEIEREPMREPPKFE